MSINPIIIRQNFKIGELDAESDTLLLENCFIDSGYLSKLLNPSDTSSIVIGRTGAEELNVNLDMFYKVLWRHILIMELLKIRHDIKSESDTNSFFSNLLSRLKKMR